MSMIERFWSKVDKTDGCWLWTGHVGKGDRDGYGKFKLDGRTTQAHRVAYELMVGPIPEGLDLDHLCRVKRCVNPAHLEAVTHRVNSLRGPGVSAVNILKTHCVNGHPFDEANTYIHDRPGHRRRCCRACNRAAQARVAQRRQQRERSA